MTTYVPERQVEYWTSRQIEDFFMNEGFDLNVYPIDQRIERYLPADHIFDFESVKLFGLQYKALYQNGGDHWRMREQQHSMLQKFSWIYYGLSDFKSLKPPRRFKSLKPPRRFRNSLHYLRLYKSNTLSNILYNKNNCFVSKLPISSGKSYIRWATFYEKLLQCDRGRKVDSRGDLISRLMPYIEEGRPDRVTERINEMADVFVINVKSQQALHFSPILTLESIEE